MKNDQHIDLVFGGVISPEQVSYSKPESEVDPRSAKRFIKGKKVFDPIAAAFICQTLCLEAEAEMMGLLENED